MAKARQRGERQGSRKFGIGFEMPVAVATFSTISGYFVNEAGRKDRTGDKSRPVKVRIAEN